jgi:hypothetical protein
MTEEKAPTRITKQPPAVKPAVTAVVVEPEVAETRDITVGGQKYTVKIEWLGNKAILAESVYKTVPLPNTSKTSRVLVAAKGTAVQGY